MPQFFTHYWSNDTWEGSREACLDTELIQHTASNLFTARGVKQEDIIFIITVIAGKLYLLGKLKVGTITNIREAAKIFQTEASSLWQAREHVTASKATTRNYDARIPDAVTKQLRFVSGAASKGAKFASAGKLDQQTMRGVRRLDAASAALLDQFLPPLKPVRRLNPHNDGRGNAPETRGDLMEFERVLSGPLIADQVMQGLGDQNERIGNRLSNNQTTPGLAEAIALAAEVHVRQVDKVGAPYILHPLRMMLRLTDVNERIAAVLHDVIEDTDITSEELLRHGFASEVVEAVLALTKRDGESYDEFIDRALSNPIARRVKLADIEDNLDLLRLSEITERDVERIRKYHRARQRLLG
jgi:hypothetical protein